MLKTAAFYSHVDKTSYRPCKLGFRTWREAVIMWRPWWFQTSGHRAIRGDGIVRLEPLLHSVDWWGSCPDTRA